MHKNNPFGGDFETSRENTPSFDETSFEREKRHERQRLIEANGTHDKVMEMLEVGVKSEMIDTALKIGASFQDIYTVSCLNILKDGLLQCGLSKAQLRTLLGLELEPISDDESFQVVKRFVNRPSDGYFTILGEYDFPVNEKEWKVTQPNHDLMKGIPNLKPGMNELPFTAKKFDQENDRNLDVYEIRGYRTLIGCQKTQEFRMAYRSRIDHVELGDLYVADDGGTYWVK